VKNVGFNDNTSGRSLIGFGEGTGGEESFYATNPATGERLQPGFISATLEEADCFSPNT
jgi:hypothetical protein